MAAAVRKVVKMLNICLFCVAFVKGQDSYSGPNLNPLPLVSSKDGYALHIDYPDGGSRTESVELLTDANGRKVPKVEGLLKLVYQDAPFMVTVMYQAGEKGYTAKYVYGSGDTRPIVGFLSANFLKSTAG